MPKSKNKKLSLSVVMPVAFCCITLIIAGIALYVRFIQNVPVVDASGKLQLSSNISSLSVASSSSLSDASVISSYSSATSDISLGLSSQQVSSSESDTSSKPTESSQSGTSSEPDASNTQPVSTVQKYSKPTEMRSVILVAGQDYLTEEGMTDEDILLEIDYALQEIINLEMNTVIIDTKYNGQVIYPTHTLPTIAQNTDFLSYIIQKARELDLYVYLTYSVLDINNDGEITTLPVIDADVLNGADKNIRELTSYYEVNGILFTNYYNYKNITSYTTYSAIGSAIGFETFMYETSQLIINTVYNAIQSSNSAIQVGLLADTVWANSADNELGSATSAEFQMYYDAYADVKTYMESGKIDFVAVEALGGLKDTSIAFGSVVSWWAELADTTKTALYTLQATDWVYPDELTRQLIEARKHKGYEGSVYNSLMTMITNTESTSTLIKTYNDQIDLEGIMQELTILSPTSPNVTTYDARIAFSGASDPNFEVLFNGKEVETNQNGYFSLYLDLAVGNNTYVITNKGRSTTYNIYRKIDVLTAVTPEGTITVDGDTQIAISAVAYKGSTVYAVINGTKVMLSAAESEDDSTVKNSSYQRFAGVYTAPKSTKVMQNLGAITVTGSCYGQTESMTGAVVKVNKILDLSDTRQVVLTAARTETFPYNTSTDLASPVTYPLPNNTTDFVVGDKITVVEDGNTLYYYKLKSGKRVYVSDCQLVAQGSFKNNMVSDIQVDVDTYYTYVKFKMDWNVPYSMALSPVSYNPAYPTGYAISSYGATTFSVSFDYTASVSADLPDLSSSPLFSSVSTTSTSSGDVDRMVFNFKLAEAGKYLGHYAYYTDDGYLTIRFNNPTSIQGAKIYLDAGHGGTDVGATGFANIYEDTLNYNLTARVRSILESYGAIVQTHAEPSSGKLVIEDRVQLAYNFSPQAFISIHHNWCYDPTVQGVETFYYTAYSMPLAKYIVNRLATHYANNVYGNGSSKYNRGAKFSRYYVTRVFDYPSVLIECGFMSNADEMMYLTDANKNDLMAQAIANGIRDYFEN